MDACHRDVRQRVAMHKVSERLMVVRQLLSELTCVKPLLIVPCSTVVPASPNTSKPGRATL